MTAVPLVPGLPDQPAPATAATATVAPATVGTGGAWRAWTFLLLRGFCMVVLAWLGTSLLWTLAPMALGLSPTLVMSGSMSPRIDAGDVVLTTPVADDGPGRLRKGAVVLADNPAQPRTKLLHRVVEVDRTTLRTKGDANPSVDSTPMPRADVDGVGRLLVPFVGRSVVWAQDGQIVGVVLSGAALLALLAAVASRTPSRLALVTVLTALGLCVATVLGANGASAAWVATAPTGLSTTRTWEFPAQQATWQGDGAWGQGGGTDNVRNQTPRAVTTPSASGWTAATTNYDSSCFINAGRLYCTGQTYDGNSGLTAGTNRTGLPTQVGAENTWSSLSSGVSNWCAIRTDKSLWCWGANDYGQLGLNDTTYRAAPVKVGSASWEKVAMGDYHTCGIQTGGTLWCWGANDRNQLGDSTTTYRYVPTKIGTSTAWTDLDGGHAHECGLQGNPGTLWCWGFNSSGQLGLNNLTNASAPTQVGSLTWTDVAAGGLHTCATRTNTLQCTGENSAYQLGDGTNTNRRVLTNVSGGATTWTQLSAGDDNSCALRDTGALFCWGENLYGQAGVGALLNPSTFVASSSQVNEVQVPTQVAGTGWTAVDVGGEHACGLASGAMKCWGKNQYGQLGAGSFDLTSSPDPVPIDSTSTPWVSISGGVSHACGVKSDRTLWCWGDNAAGELGQGDFVDRGTPTQVGSLATWVRVSSGTEYSCATRTDTSLWCWGAGASGRLGNGGTSNQPNPVQVSDTGWSVPALGNGNTCATKIDTTLWCWGVNNNGQLGLGNTTTQTSPTQVTGSGWWDVATNGSHACAVKSDTTLWCWGLNNLGQVGDVSTTTRTSPVQVAGTGWDRVETVAYHSCARKSDKSLWCWGGNQRGQVGVGDTSARNTPTRVSGSWTDVVDLAVNGSFTCAVRAAGAVWCWGKNNDGQLGLGTVAGTADQTLPVRASSAVTGTRLDDGLETLYVISPSRSYEAEDATINDGAVLTAPASRGRTAGYLDNVGSSVDFTVTADTAGTHTVRIYYASSGASTQTLTVNGGGARTVSYPGTPSGWGTHQPSQVVTQSVVLAQGTNHLVFTKASSSTELDRIVVDPP